ncbi:MauE/DoxX family redox-associated membrane protein [Persicirhabdus sediminis]|uniref:Methylamine utilisation protein MauE domain-containing protein n=1 Tax=Persicirhabdus sediminis TaxID=454144 RepID=A0A8J7MCC8_9BACT|nr:MauE/DoxX family redox-associated membrane protein [Persicirhabdus sediminis]MBK1789901.1 hypothetical protein [Persicirhabdus sediminis]
MEEKLDKFQWLCLALRVSLGVYLIYFAGVKLLDIKAFSQSIMNYRLAPFDAPPWDALAAYFTVSLEILLGVCLIFRRFYAGALLVTAVMFAGFIGMIASAWARGLNINCGCFGASDEPTNYPLHIGLNVLVLLILLVLALYNLKGKSLAADEIAA